MKPEELISIETLEDVDQAHSLRAADGRRYMEFDSQFRHALDAHRRRIMANPPESTPEESAPLTADQIREHQNARGSDGRRLYETDPRYRHAVEAAWRGLYGQ